MDKPMVQPETDTPDENAQLAALADGSLPAERRRALENEVAASPELAALLAEQQLATSLVRNLDVAAPASLRAEVNRLTSRRARTRPSLLRRPTLTLGLIGAAAAVIAVVTLALPGGPGGPTVVQAATLAGQPATLPAPAKSPAHTDLLAASESGVAYPYWDDAFGWRAVGARTDVLHGRHVTTVFYTRAGRRIAYSIVAGSPLTGVRHWRTVTRSGVRLWVARTAGGTLVTWQRRGHSCVLTGRGVSATSLEALASWHGSSGMLYR